MEQEAFFSGNCRAMDGSRMVTVEAGEIDCGFESCPYAPNCQIAKKIRELLAQP